MTTHSLINLKGRFPFRLSTTSYILPDAIMPNLRFLGPRFDEIELVLFESRYGENLPSKMDIREMAALADDLHFTYNVHLPMDLLLGSPDPEQRRESCETILRFYERTLPLAPTAYILHFEGHPGGDPPLETLAQWRHLLRASLTWLIDQGLHREQVALENLSYPFAWVDILADEFDLKICLDLGHLILQNADLMTTFNRYQERTSMMHLHGVGHRDHLALSLIPHDEWQTVKQILRRFSGGLSLEVFSLEDLQDSLIRMEDVCSCPD
jgi:sugar phosphate isomerase/epimerase